MEQTQIRNKNQSKGITRSGNKIRHRLSDAKWRANLANCYSRLGRVLINDECSCKVKVTKAAILKETVNHILFLENTIEALIREQAHRKGNAYGPLPWESSLHYLQSKFLAHEQDAKNEISHDASNFTNTISPHPVLPTTNLDMPHKGESIIPISFTPSLHDGLCVEDHCYHLTAATYSSYLTSQNQTLLQFLCPKQNEFGTSEITKGQRGNKEYNGMRKRPLKEINNILKTKTEKCFAQDCIKICCRMKRSPTDLQDLTFQTPLHSTKLCCYCPPTPMKANKFKENFSHKRSIRTRRSLEKLMNNTTQMKKISCEENHEIKIKQGDEFRDGFIFPQKESYEASSLSSNDNRYFSSNKLSKEVLKAPVIMKVQKAIGSFKDKSHDSPTVSASPNSCITGRNDFTLDYMNINSKEPDLFKLEETNQEVPDKEILCKNKLHSNVDFHYLPDIHDHNNSDIAILLLHKNEKHEDQAVPELNETSSYNKLKNSAKYTKSFTSSLYKNFKESSNNSSVNQEIFHSSPEKLNVMRQDTAYEIMSKNLPHETAVKNSMVNSQKFLIQAQDPILTSATLTTNQTSLIEHPHKNCPNESPSRSSTDNKQHIGCQQTGCCWSPCQELTSATLFDTVYHDANEI